MELLDGVSTQKERTRLVLNNILVATDFSSSSEMALKYALALARHYHAKVHIIQAVALDSVEAIASDARQRALDEERSFAISCAKKLRVSGKLDGVRHQVLVGEEGESILRTLLQNQDFDLYVNGVGNSEGHMLLLEPTVEEAIRRSQCPLLSVGSSFHASFDGELKSIVFATDFSPESLEASRYALSLAQEFQARLTLMHVVEGFEPRPSDEKAHAARPYKLWLSKLVPDEARLWSELDFAVEFGRPADRILQVAWENRADLIVVGAHGLDRLTSPGLNVRKVMCNAWCPVLTVSGVLDSEKLERFWRAADAASESQKQQMIAEVI